MGAQTDIQEHVDFGLRIQKGVREKTSVNISISGQKMLMLSTMMLTVKIMKPKRLVMIVNMIRIKGRV